MHIDFDTDDVKNWIVEKTKDIPGTIIDGTQKAYTIAGDKLQAIKDDYIDKEAKIKTLDAALDKACAFICSHGCPCYNPCEERISEGKNCTNCLKEKFISEAKSEKKETNS